MFPLHGYPSKTHLARLKKLLRANKKVKLCYVTGRNLKLTIYAIRKYSLPIPDYLITNVGTNIYLKSGTTFRFYKPWQKLQDRLWTKGTSRKILNACSKISGVAPQPIDAQSMFKVSFYLRPKLSKKALEQVRKKLDSIDIKATIVTSTGKQKSLLLDILPNGISKKSAIKTLAKKIGIGYSNIVFVGESGNDYSVLISNLKAVIVSNAEIELKKRILKKVRVRRNLPTVYFTRGLFDCAKGENVAGVLEGALHYGLFSKKKGMYIQIHSIHGLINHNYTDIGRDEDTGGQVVYVVELAKSLSHLPDVGGVDLMTRRIDDPKYPNYAKRVEYLTEKARIVRIDCGPKKYLKKTSLWPYLPQYISNTLKFNEEEGLIPDILHANYADAGLACTKLSKLTQTPLVFTAHSLGWPKMDNMGVTKENMKFLNSKFHFSCRLAAEQTTMDAADVIITSTKQELCEQYKKYNVDARKVRIVPPGINTNVFNAIQRPDKDSKRIFKMLTKGLLEPHKPMILAMARLDAKKNLVRLTSAFCRDSNLPKLANLIIITGGIKKHANEDQKAIHQKIKDIIKSTNNEQRVSISKFIESGHGVASIYKTAAQSKGVFVNPALAEPFGLTIIESSACGLPVVATKNGGPREIIHHGKDGLLVNPLSEKNITSAITRLLKDRNFWKSVSKNAISNAAKYGWDKTAQQEMNIFKELIKEKETMKVRTALVSVFKHSRT